MKFIFIVGLLIGILYVAFNRAKTGLSKEHIIATATSAIPSAPSSPGTNSSFIASVDKSVGRGAFPVEKEIPQSSKVVTFAFREVPAPEFLSNLSSLGVSFIVDAPSRSVLLRGPYQAVQDAADFLEKADTVSNSCAMRSWVLFVSDADTQGFDLAAMITSSLSPDAFSLTANQNLLLNVSVDHLTATINAVLSSSRVQLLQEPHCRLYDGKEARIESLEEVPIRSTTISNGLATTSIDYKRVGLEMVVMPRFFANDLVRLDVTQIGGLVGRTVDIDGAEVPILQTQKVASSLSLTVGQAFVLGGVRSTRVRKARGILSRSDEFESGILYVVCAIYEDTPRANVVVPEWFKEMQPMLVPSVLPEKGLLLPE